MTTIPDSVKAQLDADWTGAGGAEPAYYVEEDFRTNPPLGQDAVWILSSTLDTDPVPFNDIFVHDKHVLEMVVNTLTSEDRLKELGDEVVRILNATPITDITYQRLKRRKITSGVDKGVFNYQEVITYDLQQQMKSSAAAYGAGATGDFAVVGNLTVGGTAEITGVTTFADESITSTQIANLLMFGTSNKVWVPMVYEGDGNTTIKTRLLTGRVSNVDGTDSTLSYNLVGVPMVKGGLKLYVDGLQVHIFSANGTNFITNVFLGLWLTASNSQIIDDATNRTAQGAYEYTDTAVDASAAQTVKALITTTVADAGALRIVNVSARCYYAT